MPKKKLAVEEIVNHVEGIRTISRDYEKLVPKRQTAEMRNRRKNAKPAEGTLRVWHIPQVPGKPFYVEGIESDLEAIGVISLLADYDLFQYENKVKPDYNSVSGLEIYQRGEWVEWKSEEGEDISEIMRRERT